MQPKTGEGIYPSPVHDPERRRTKTGVSARGQCSISRIYCDSCSRMPTHTRRKCVLQTFGEGVPPEERYHLVNWLDELFKHENKLLHLSRNGHKVCLLRRHGWIGWKRFGRVPASPMVETSQELSETVRVLDRRPPGWGLGLNVGTTVKRRE